MGWTVALHKGIPAPSSYLASYLKYNGTETGRTWMEMRSGAGGRWVLQVRQQLQSGSYARVLARGGCKMYTDSALSVFPCVSSFRNRMGY